ncbi:MAG: MinD/ParA family protein [Vicinamibacterales bacterium]
MSAMAVDFTPGDSCTVVGITSGKGGVGKTALAINLAIALARRGHRVGLVDADFALGKIDVMLGLTPRAHLGHVLGGERALEETVLTGPAGIQVVPAGTGIRQLAALDPEHWLRLAHGLERFRENLDFLLLDTAAGVSDNVVDLMAACQRVLVVTSPDPSALVDGYAVVKLVAGEAPGADLGLVVNQARTPEEASLVFRHLETAARRFLGRRLSFYGSIPHDPALGEAVRAQQALVDLVPQAPASRSFRLLASRLAGLGPVPSQTLRLPARTLALAYSRTSEVSRCA